MQESCHFGVYVSENHFGNIIVKPNFGISGEKQITPENE